MVRITELAAAFADHPDAKRHAATADAIRAAGVPDFCNRYLTTTPDAMAASNAKLKARTTEIVMKAPAPGSKEAQVRALRISSKTIAAADKVAASISTPKATAQASTTEPKAQPDAVNPESTMNTATHTTTRSKPIAALIKLSGKKAKKPKKAKAAKKAKTAKAATPKKAKAATTPKASGRYDWPKHEAAAKTGVIPPMPDFEAYRPHLKDIHELAKKKDADGIKTYCAKFKTNPIGGRANLFHFRDLCLEALKAQH